MQVHQQRCYYAATTGASKGLVAAPKFHPEPRQFCSNIGTCYQRFIALRLRIYDFVKHSQSSKRGKWGYLLRSTGHA
jgi:hypothetical protein